MPRYLALDWDQQHLRVVEATVAKGSVRIHRAAAWPVSEAPSVAGAEAQGRWLRERLQEAGIAPAPLLVALGRERVILKDIRYPAVPESEEPAIVRFQAAKELTESPEDMVLDYFPMETRPDNQRRALLVAARRDVVEAYQALAKAANTKLVAIAPRTFGSAACLYRLAGASVLTPAIEPADATVAILAVSDAWAEFSVFRQEKLQFSRALATGDGLSAEIRRNLVVHAGQMPLQPVQALYLAGENDVLARLQGLDELGVPVHPLDPFAGEEKQTLPTSGRGAFLGAVGLLHAQADKNGLAVNLAQPRQPRVERDPDKRRLVAVCVFAAVVLLAGVVLGKMRVNAVADEVDAQTKINEDLDNRLARLEDDAKKIKALSEWQDGNIVWLDELYDMTYRIGGSQDIRLTLFSADPLTPTAQNPHVAKVTLNGLTTKNNTEVVDPLVASLADNGRNKVSPKKITTNDNTADNAVFPHQFAITDVEIGKAAPGGYNRLIPMTPDKSKRGRNR